jgi:hypothetical protein
MQENCIAIEYAENPLMLDPFRWPSHPGEWRKKIIPQKAVDNARPSRSNWDSISDDANEALTLWQEGYFVEDGSNIYHLVQQSRWPKM